MTETACATGWYVYGIVEAGVRPIDLDDTPEIGGLEAARSIESAGLAAVVSRVDLGEFDERALPERLNDPVWLEAKARAHEEVLEAVARQRTIVPLRFGTIFLGTTDVRSFVSERETALRQTIERVRGRVELGVKAWGDRATMEAAWNEAAGQEGAEAEAPGRSYLLERRREQRRSRELSALCQEVVADAHRRLLRLAVEGVANRPHARELSGRSEQMLLNAAYLTQEDDSSIAAEVAALDVEHREVGISFELTGPWPPHNFVDLPDESP
jgi:gas vesicle protein GvpL/GvpF